MSLGLKGLAKSVIPRTLWSKLRLWKLRRSVSQFKTRDVSHIYAGVPLTVHLADPLGQGWYDHDWAVPQEFDVLKAGQLRTGARVFDLGAHQGIVALLLSNIVGPSGSVIAIEALPHNAEVAQKNRNLNQATQLKVVHAAVSDKPGVIEFNGGLNGMVDDGTGMDPSISVPAVTIDGLAAEYGTPQVIYLDVEGFECHALRGASKTLESRPDAFVEIHVKLGLEKFGGSIDEVLSYFPVDIYEHFMGTDAPIPFVPFVRDNPITKERFFLVARNRATANPQ